MVHDSLYFMFVSAAIVIAAIVLLAVTCGHRLRDVSRDNTIEAEIYDECRRLGVDPFDYNHPNHPYYNAVDYRAYAATRDHARKPHNDT